MSFILLPCYSQSKPLYLLYIFRLYVFYPFAIHYLTHHIYSTSLVCMYLLSLPCDLWSNQWYLFCIFRMFVLSPLSCHSLSDPLYLLCIFRLYVLHPLVLLFAILPITHSPILVCMPFLFLPHHLLSDPSHFFCAFRWYIPFSLCYASDDLTHHTHSAPSECMFYLHLHGL